MEVVPDSELVDVESLEVWLKDEALVAEGAVGSAIVGPTGDAVYVSRNVRGGRDIGVVDGMRPCEDATAVAGTISVSEFRVNFDGCDPAWVRLQNYGMELVVASSAGLVRAGASSCGGDVEQALAGAEEPEVLEAAPCESVVSAITTETARIRSVINAGAVLLRSSAVLSAVGRDAAAVAAKVAALPAETRAHFGTVVWVKMPSFPWWPSYVLDPIEMGHRALEMWKKCNAATELIVLYVNDNRLGKARIDGYVRPWDEASLAELREGRLPGKKGKKKAGKNGKGGSGAAGPTKPCSAKVKKQLDGAVAEALAQIASGSAEMFREMRDQFLLTKLASLASDFSAEWESFADRKDELRDRAVKCARAANRGRKDEDKKKRRELREERRETRREEKEERRRIRQLNAEARQELKSQKQMEWEQRRAVWAERKAGRELSQRARNRMRSLHHRPPKFRRLRMNKYPDPSWRSRCAPSEAPQCDCTAAGDCDESCINRCLYVECAAGCCPSVASAVAAHKAEAAAAAAAAKLLETAGALFISFCLLFHSFVCSSILCLLCIFDAGAAAAAAAAAAEVGSGP
jgi:hypothetical protein